MLALLVMSRIGSFGGYGWLAEPWDSVVVAVIGVVTFVAGTFAARAHLEANPVPEPYVAEDELATAADAQR